MKDGVGGRVAGGSAMARRPARFGHVRRAHHLHNESDSFCSVASLSVLPSNLLRVSLFAFGRNSFNSESDARVPSQ